MSGPGEGSARGAEGGAGAPRRWRAVTGEVARDPVSRGVFAAVAVAAGLGYSVLLPFSYTQRISLANWQYVGPRYAAFTAAFALGLAWVVTLQVHAVRKIARSAASSGRTGVGRLGGALAAAVSLLPSFLCCSPVVPTLVSLIGLPVATQLRTTGTITYFFATGQDWLLAGALAVLAASGAWSVRKLARVACLAQDCCPAGDAAAGAAGQPEQPRSGAPDAPARAAAAGGHDHGGGQ
jgi:hypothetical protein